MNYFKIGSQKLKENRCFIIFEAGPTHNGYMSAKNLVYMAKRAGGDAIKFQIFNSEKLISDKNQLFEYSILTKKNKIKTVRESLYKIFKRRELTNFQWKKIAELCKKLKICFFATCGYNDEINFLKKIGCQSIKIASADVNHYPLIKKAANTNLCVQLDTGKSSIDEIKTAVKILEKNGCKKIIIHHCPSGYPASSDNINLNVIKTLKKTFKYPIAYSDHSPGFNMDIAALSIGANVLEKTITENRKTPSVEHIMSLEFEEMKLFVKSIRELEKAFGNYKRKLSSLEKKGRDALRRSLFLDENVKKGQKLKDVKYLFRRPGYGIQPHILHKIENKRFVKNFVKGHQLKVSELK